MTARRKGGKIHTSKNKEVLYFSLILRNEFCVYETRTFYVKLIQKLVASSHVITGIIYDIKRSTQQYICLLFFSFYMLMLFLFEGWRRRALVNSVWVYWVIIDMELWALRLFDEIWDIFVCLFVCGISQARFRFYWL